MKRIALFLSLIALAVIGASAQTKTDPLNRIDWPLLGVSGSPISLGMTCDVKHYAQPITDISVTPNKHYICGTDGWELQGSGGSGTSVNGIVSSSTAITASCGQMIRADSTSAITVTLSSTVLTGCNYGITRGVSAGVLTINPNGIAYDGVTNQLPQGTTLYIWTDGTGYHSTVPMIPGSNVSFTPSLGGNQINAAGGGGTYTCADSSGSPNTQICTASPILSSLTLNTCIAYTTTTPNVGALTLSVSGSGAKSVVKWLGTALADGDMPANKSQMLCYDGTSWDVSTIGNAPSSGSSGTVNTGANYAVPAYGSASSTVLGPSNCTTDSSLNNFMCPGFLAPYTAQLGLSGVSRPLMATWAQALQNAGHQAVHLTMIGDSYMIHDMTNAGTGPTISTDRWVEQIRLRLQNAFGYGGTGIMPLVYTQGGGVPLNSEIYSSTGTLDRNDGSLGPSGGSSTVNTLVHMNTGSTVTFTANGLPYDTLYIYCMTTSSSGSIAVNIDSGAHTGTVCNTTTGSHTAHAVSVSAGTLATHSVTITSTGDSYVYAMEGTAGTTGVRVSNLGWGGAQAEWWWNAGNGFAFSDLEPAGTQGAVVMLQTNEINTGVLPSNFGTFITDIVTHELGLSGTPSVLLVVPPVSSASGAHPASQYTAQQLAVQKANAIDLVNIQWEWGATQNLASGLWTVGDSLHPGSKGNLSEYAQVIPKLIESVPPGSTAAFSVNNAPVPNANFNATTPAAPSGNVNCLPQVSGSNFGCYVPFVSFAQAAATLGATVTSATIGPTPLPGSLQLFANGLILRPGTDWTLSGSLASFSPNLSSGTNLVGQWASSTSGTGGFTFSFPTLRGSAKTSGALSSYAITLPTGSLAADTVFLSWSSSCPYSSPTGTWTLLQNSSTGGYQQAEASHTLTSGDITAGNITVPVSCTGGWANTILLGLVGSHTLRESDTDNTGAWNCSKLNPDHGNTTSAVLSTDTLFWVYSENATATITTTTTNATLVDSLTTSGDAVAIFTLAPPHVSAGVNGFSSTFGGGSCQYSMLYVYE